MQISSCYFLGYFHFVILRFLSQMRRLAATIMKQSLLMKQHSLLQLGNLALSSVKKLNQVFLYGRDILLLKSQMKGNSKFSIYGTSPADSIIHDRLAKNGRRFEEPTTAFK